MYFKFKISSLNVEKIEVFLFSLSLFALSAPYFLWHSSIPNYCMIICLFIAMRQTRLIDRSILAPIILLSILYLIMGIRNSTLNLFGCLSIILIPFFFYLNKKFVLRVFNLYSLIFSITLIPSIFVYLLLLLGINIPNEIISPLNPLKNDTYLQYPFLITIQSPLYGILPRFFAYYDEPGVVGTIATVLLIVRKFKIKNLVNIPIIIAGLLSLSLFFYLVLMCFLMINLKLKYNLIILVIVSTVIIFLYDNPILNTFLFNRFSFDEKHFIVDNRTNSSFDNWYEDFKCSSDYYWGLGGGSSAIYNRGGASYKNLIVDYGFFFFFFYLLSFIILAVKRIGTNLNLFNYLILFFGVIYQRPFITNWLYVFLLFSSLYKLDKYIKPSKYD